MTRRDITWLLSFLAVSRSPAAGSGVAHSKVFKFNELPVMHSTGGAITRPVFRGTLGTGEVVEIHETTLMPGQMPHPAHQHVHTEFMMIREGTVEFLLDSGPQQAGPGGVLYAASGEKHGLKNTGSIPANYFVIAIGADAPH